MTSLKRSFDDDDGDLKDIDDKVGVDDFEDDSDAGEVLDELMQMPPSFPNLPDMWLCKLPKSLMDKWQAIQTEGVELAKMQVWAGDGSQAPVIRLVLPEKPQYDTSLESRMYKFDIGAQAGAPPPVEINRYIFSDEPKEDPNKMEGDSLPPPSKRPRTTKLLGRVAHRGSLVPIDKQDAKYHNRFRTANEKTRTTISIETDKVQTGDGGGFKLDTNYKMLNAGVNKNSTTLNFQSQAARKGKETKDKKVRLPKNIVLDKIMVAYQSKDYYSFKELSAIVDIPDDQLREILQEIAEIHRSGPHTNKYELKKTLKNQQISDMIRSGEPIAGPSGSGVKYEDGVKREADMAVDEDEDEEEESDGFEEVS